MADENIVVKELSKMLQNSQWGSTAHHQQANSGVTGLVGGKVLFI